MAKRATKRRGPGRPPKHTPTPEKIEQARAMAAYGMRREDIAKAMGMAKSTFMLHYPEHLEGADQEALHKIARTLFQIATDPQHPKCVSAAIWLEKTRGGRSETQNVNMSLDVGDIYREETEKWLKRAEAN